MDQPGKERISEEHLPRAEKDIEGLTLYENRDLSEDAARLAAELFGENSRKCAVFIRHVLDVCRLAEGKDFLLVHNPGGWGSSPLDRCLHWEKSLVQGVRGSVERLGYSLAFIQYFRSGPWWVRIRDFKEHVFFFPSGAREMAAELKFITGHFRRLKVLLIGVSQGAAFSNAVMQRLGKDDPVYSIEVGIFFLHMPRRVISERTLVIDGNGVVPDPVAHRDLRIGIQAYLTAPYRWVRYWLRGTPQSFSYCINVPGHDYNWEYPDVRRKVTYFLDTHFGMKNKVEVGLHEAGKIY